ncbi:hypothetical protein KL937_003518 [Ogataea polymorpha]|nr:uncharacterized protein OGAPODRAFT_17408 [Ogataea polymorpha]KAG7879105.1 hypothetical protein KL937_003518 [Ogataea polymorpha]KAG7892168.1 hypothetical protein KL908_003773 [Ogataea polymorpha]KAG7915515.1 hypothetical protein KL927_003791 [Ogataea polymorpha]KAG7932917.1 hypothetical protein KL934_003572 [Ogataea polymorpha]KAG7934365.1 hypothetical protein KL904_003699 [Ogataea polymorpha]
MNGLSNSNILAPSPGQDAFSPLAYNLLSGDQSQERPNAPIENQMAALTVDDSHLKTQDFLHPFVGQQQSPTAALNALKAQFQLPKVDPSNIKWYYLDASNNEQGPFDSSLMQQWYSLRYFDYGLKIRREEQQTYMTLAEFIQSIGEYLVPFSVPLAPVINQPATAPVFSSFQERTHWTPSNEQSQSASVTQSLPEPAKTEEAAVPKVDASDIERIVRKASGLSVSTKQETREPEPAPKSEGLPAPEKAPEKAAEKAAEPVKPKPQSPTTWAPWASKSPVKPTKTLAEIQSEEAERRKKEQKEAEAAKSLAASLAPKQEAPKPAVALPSAATWASSGTVSQAIPTMTLEEIQREEAAKLHASNSAAKQKPSTASFAEVTASSGWSTVSSKKTAKPAVAAPTKTNKQSAVISPNVLRSVSAPAATPAKKPVVGSTVASPKPQPVTNSSSPARDFLVWCRTQLSHLHKGIDKEDILSIIIQFPTGSESQEIIADTIYSNSATMDGRRFASEFMKRKAEVEKLVKAQGIHFSWGEALNASARGQEDDFDMAFTKVVSKKNRRKN